MVYVCYSDYGPYDGCSEPLVVYRMKAEAQAWVDRQDKLMHAAYREMIVGKEYE